MIDQMPILRELSETRNKIHSLCAKSQCIKYHRCHKFGSVCTNDEQSPFRKVIRNNGGDFEKYLRIRKQLMEINYPLVISLANNMGGYSIDDLCQEGMLGLCEAIDRFDLSYNNQFSTFAYFYIKKAVLDFIRVNQTVRLATRISYLSKITEQAFDRLVQKKRSALTITPKELLKEVLSLRKEKKMGKMAIRDTEVTLHLSRLQMQITMFEVKPLEPNKFEHQEHSDSFYNLLNRQLEYELSDEPIWVSEAVKLRFGLGAYTSPTPIPEIAAALGKPKQTVEHNVKQFFEKFKSKEQ